MKRPTFRETLLSALLLLPLSARADAVLVEPERMDDSASIRLSLDRLATVGGALYVAAHPDDENTAMISWLANGKLVRTAYLAATRGDGGQNLIGNEQGPMLGIIRTHELLEARQVDGGTQFFSRAIDFGYSKSAHETLRFWGKERVLADFVRVIREFRPDVIINRFSTDGAGGHGHHAASAILTLEAFRLAADPSAYPEQLTELRPWQARRLFWNAYRFQGGAPASPEATAGLIAVDLGEFNPLLGLSYTELAGESRSMHKSQGFGAPERRGTNLNYLLLLAGDPATDDPFEGIDLTWRRIAGGEAIIPLIDRAIAAYRVDDPSTIIAPLLAVRQAIASLQPSEFWQRRVIEEKLEQVDELIRQAGGIWIEAIATSEAAVPGSTIEPTVTIVSRSAYPVSVSLALARSPISPPEPLEPNEPWSKKVSLEIPRDTPFTHPDWLRRAPHAGAYDVGDAAAATRAVAKPAVRIPLVLWIGEQPIPFEVPVMVRWTDPVLGERYRRFEIHPPVTANLESGVVVFPDARPKRVRLELESSVAKSSGTVMIVVPEGWRAEPATMSYSIDGVGNSNVASTVITPPATAPAEGAVDVMIQPEGWNTAYSLARAEIDYPHIPPQTLLPHATAKLVRADIRTAGNRIGYVMGAGDEVPAALRQIGYEVALLTDEDLESGDLSTYDAIVIGVRAYNTRKRLGSFQPRLFDWVRDGGTLVTQYNTLGRDLPPQLGPFPLELSRDRVTDEQSGVTILAPTHPVMTVPNRITEADFRGWIQERGLYFPSGWNEAYQPLLGMADPGEAETRGSLLVARHGAGVFVYAPLSFFRQLPAGVPGAYRLFANLVASRDGEARAAD